ncbi:MAG: hypothetical protein LBG96_03140 [Tannerella sp.]|jgi:hypothetical protein|nr:hypothetical protein [Tannerella sp.]
MKRKVTTKKTANKAAKEVYRAEKPKSAYTMFREKHPDGIGEIVNMRAVLR